MSAPNFVILYVNDPITSSEFYAKLLQRPVIEAAETFAMLELESGLMLGLWSKHTVQPVATTAGGGMEIGFPVQSQDAVDTMHRQWRDMGLSILQAPTQMDFGYTFVALDPDQHRLRVFVPSAS